MFINNLKQTISKLHFIAFELLFLATACLLIFNASIGQDKSQFFMLSLLYLVSLLIFSSDLIKKAYESKNFISTEIDEGKN